MTGASRSSSTKAKKTADRLRTRSGALLTPEAEADLVAEAEAGFDPARLVARKLAS